MSSNKIKDDEQALTAKQCKAARAFLGWSQDYLAEKVSVTQKTIADFEREARIPQKRTVRDIKKALEEAGIKFKNANGSLIVELTDNDN